MEVLQTEARTEAIVDADIYELVPGFCESRKKDLRNISSYLAVDDFNAIAKVSHTIKGIARPYGFPTLETLITKLEKAAKASDKAGCEQIFKDIEIYFKGYCA